MNPYNMINELPVTRVTFTDKMIFVHAGARQYPFRAIEETDKLKRFAVQKLGANRVQDLRRKTSQFDSRAPKTAPRHQGSQAHANNEPWPSQGPSKPSYDGRPSGKLSPEQVRTLFRTYELATGRYPDDTEQAELVRAAEYPRSGSVQSILETVATWRHSVPGKDAPKSQVDNTAWDRAVDTFIAFGGSLVPTVEEEALSHLRDGKPLSSPSAKHLVRQYREAVEHPLHCHGEIGSN